ncbi:MAG TPA: aminopeptidase N [Moraxellaceae bacterium]|nr:aminopeptidase N [Moraxellaceae bacterium]
MSAESAKPAIFLADYQAPAYRVHTVDLVIDIHDGHTDVAATLDMERAPGVPVDVPLRLHGVDLELLEMQIDGRELMAGERLQRGEELEVTCALPDRFTLHSRVRIHPERNTALEGLYRSNGMFCTQCEAEGFRKITFYPDRPDVMARFTTTLRGDRARFPVLLANGNPVAAGDLGEGRHFVTWEDPFPKPSYLFAMVAGDLACQRGTFVTRSGRTVDLRIYVESHDTDKVDHAMDSLKRAMRWDEEVYGREYDLDIYMIVAVSHFNMGAMENKGLNIFNTSCVLAHPSTTTDAGFQRVESVIAHEYFHNWSGNRVTCRDWFQLSLKEGFTVFRDQQFSADMLSASVQRIEDVNFLRAYQFGEDAGPLAHPVRPESFVEINNFYTATVYDKGAEVVRMLHTVLGLADFRRGTDLYFSRHDGQAVTVEDFIQALSDASGRDLSSFMQWYRQPGTPVLHARGEYVPERLEYRLHLRQEHREVDGFPASRPVPVPVRMALLGRDGREMVLSGNGGGVETVIVLEHSEQTFVFSGIPFAPVPSLLRNFSAPVRLEQSLSLQDKLFLMRHDSNGFNRWLMAQDLLSAEFLRLAGEAAAGRHLLPDPALLEALVEALPLVAEEDPALAAKLMQVPGLQQLIDAAPCPDPEALHMGRQCFRHALARRLEGWLLGLVERGGHSDYAYGAQAIAERSLRNTALALLVDLAPDHHRLAVAQINAARHMTDEAAALVALVHADAAEAPACLERFASRWQHEALVMDQWFGIQASAPLAGTVQRVGQLRDHRDFHRDNPNRVRALLGQFANNNPRAFHEKDGSGYRLLIEEVARLDVLNPQIAARLLGAMSSWHRFDAGLQSHARSALTQLATRELSSDVRETLERLRAADRMGANR